MSPTVRPPPASDAAGCVEPPDESGAWRSTTVVVLPLSIAPVPSSTAATTATTSPPRTPARRLDLPFTTGEGRGAPLIRRKPRVRRYGDEAAQACERAAALGESPPQGPPVVRGRRAGGARTGIALVAQTPHVARGVRAGG